MRELTYYIALTLDGFIAGPDDEVDFYPLADDHSAYMNEHYPEMLPTHVRQAIGFGDVPNRRYDSVIMGRRTYDPALEAGITSPYAHLRQLVVSRSLEASADPAVELVRDDPRARVQQYQRYFSDADRILIMLHNDPDPDAIASGLALRNVLRRTKATAISEPPQN